MEVQGYIKRKITEEQRKELQELKVFLRSSLNNKENMVYEKVTKESFCFIHYKTSEWMLKDAYSDKGYFSSYNWCDGEYTLGLSHKGDNRIALANLFSGEEPLQAYLSPVLSQALTNFIKELK